MIGPILRSLGRRQAAVALLILEVGLGFAVSVQAFEFGRWFADKVDAPTGVVPGALVLRGDLAGGDPTSPTFLASLRRRDVDALRAVPGVVAATAANFIPQHRTLHPQAVETRGRAGSRWSMSWVLDGQPATCDALGVAIADGRNLGEFDRDGVLVSPGLAGALFDGSPLGKTVFIRGRERAYTVVGVTSPVRGPQPIGLNSDRVLFVPDPIPLARQQRYLVRAAAGRVDEVRAAATAALAHVFPERVVRATALTEVRDFNDRSGRGGMAIFDFMVALAILVTLLGALAMSSFLVAERTKQIGTRRALGATKRDVVRYFLLENWLVTTLGLMFGLPITFLLHVLVTRQQPDLRLAWSSIVLGMVAFWATGLVAALVPALRATTVSPSVASKTV